MTRFFLRLVVMLTMWNGLAVAEHRGQAINYEYSTSFAQELLRKNEMTSHKEHLMPFNLNVQESSLKTHDLKREQFKDKDKSNVGEFIFDSHAKRSRFPGIHEEEWMRASMSITDAPEFTLAQVEASCSRYKKALGYSSDLKRQGGQDLEIQCRGTPYCLDGTCGTTIYTPNKEMLSILTQLSVLKAIQEDIKSGSLELFKGEIKRCKKNKMSFRDCCSLEGWGLDTHMAQCNEEAKSLFRFSRMGLCHSIGTYCSRRVLRKCVTKKTSSCCFRSKLHKLIQEQARDQLKIGWGEPKYPNCQGLTAEQLAQVDFSKLDFSSLYDELSSTYKSPNLAQVKATITERARELQRKESDLPIKQEGRKL